MSTIKQLEYEVEQLEAERKTLRQQLRTARLMTEDLLSERGLPAWLFDLRDKQEVLFDHIGRARCHRHGESYSRDPCSLGLAHRPDCVLGQLLRIVGGPEETQRQVDAAHDIALFHANLVSRATATALQDHEHLRPGRGTSRDIYYGVLARGVARADEDD